MRLTLDSQNDIRSWCRRWNRLLCLRHGVLLVLCLLLPRTQANMYEGDACRTKLGDPGICTLGSRCTILREDVNAGRISSDDVVSCGQAPREEIVCCPAPASLVPPTQTDRSGGDGKHYFGTPTTTTAEPDFWVHLLTTSTTTTSPKPLVIGDQELNKDSEFFDFSKLLTKPTSTGSGDSFPQKDSVKNPGREGRHDSNSLGNVRNQITQSQSKWPVKDSFAHFQSPQRPISAPPLETRPTNFGSSQRPSPAWQIQRPELERDNRNNGDRWSANGRSLFHPSITEKHPTWETDNQIGAGSPPTRNIWPKQPQNSRNFDSQMGAGSLPIRNIWPKQPQNSRNIGHQFESQQQWGNNNRDVEIFLPGINSGPKAPLIRPAEKEWTATNPSQIAFPNEGSRPWEPTVHPSNIDYNNPISTVNTNLINSGMDLVSAKLDKVDRTWDRKRPQFEATTTHRSIVPDPFLPFQFRPSPTGSSGTSSHQFVDQSARPTNSSIDAKPTGVTVRTPSRSDERPAVAACRRLENNMVPSLTPHILNGIPAEEGEYPHMAAIGYSQLGEDTSSGRYDWSCGGTLIESRFVLTAAHCVNSRERRPSVVRLGVVNLTDPSATTVPIKTVHIHDDYRGSSKYNDIAILELEEDLNFQKLGNVYPTCLYTDLADPPETEKLYVTGWGTTELKSRNTSSVLLHANVKTVPIDKCNETYVNEGLINRQLQFGVDASQLCAYDSERDACQGDSGGPLHWVVDKAYPKYRVVGIISAGISCGTATPALYTRVASFLNYIERIVWPDESRS